MEVIQGLLDNIMIALKVPFADQDNARGYTLEGKDCKYCSLSLSLNNFFRKLAYSVSITFR